jgi:hypothetical protein
MKNNRFSIKSFVEIRDLKNPFYEFHKDKQHFDRINLPTHQVSKLIETLLKATVRESEDSFGKSRIARQSGTEIMLASLIHQKLDHDLKWQGLENPFYEFHWKNRDLPFEILIEIIEMFISLLYAHGKTEDILRLISNLEKEVIERS